MTFKEWALENNNDNRDFHIILKLRNGSKIFYHSNQQISYMDLYVLQDSTILEKELVDDEWFFVLTV